MEEVWTTNTFIWQQVGMQLLRHLLINILPLYGYLWLYTTAERGQIRWGEDNAKGEAAEALPLQATHRQGQ